MASFAKSRRRNSPPRPIICREPPPEPPDYSPGEVPETIRHVGWFDNEFCPADEWYEATLQVVDSGPDWLWRGNYDGSPTGSFAEFTWNEISKQGSLYMNLKTGINYERAKSNYVTFYPSEPRVHYVVNNWFYLENQICPFGEIWF